MGIFYFVLVLSRWFEQGGDGEAMLVKILAYGKTQNTTTEEVLSICLAVWGVYQCDIMAWCHVGK